MNRLIMAVAALIPLVGHAGAFEEAEALRVQGKHVDALPFYLEAAKTGHPVANHWAGTYYYEGMGVEANSDKSAPYFLAAAHLGVEGSMVYLANMFYSGNGFPKDCDRSEYWITKASNGAPAKEWKERLERCQ